jgi:hypothetical protein
MPSKTAGSTTYCFFIVLKLTTELLLSILYLGAEKAPFSVVSDSNKNATLSEEFDSPTVKQIMPHSLISSKIQ